METLISLTDEEHAYASSLVARGLYASISSVIQDGLALLRQNAEAHAARIAALQGLVDLRRVGRFVPLEDADGLRAAMEREG
ncbi:MAG: type II toxin-antitoxin system ParD family antitoxin [Acetobacteraceae bacterium]